MCSVISVYSPIKTFEDRFKRESKKKWMPDFASMTKKGLSFPNGSNRESNKATMKQYYVYILVSKKNGTLYIGVSNNLIRRVYEHKHSLIDGFTKKYNIKNLVYYEIHKDIEEAIKREKAMKKWNREWKIRLIEKNNPNWDDLYNEIM